MTRRLCALVGAAALILTLAPSGALAQGDIPRAFDGNPDLNGVWQVIGTAHWDLQDHPAGPGLPDMGAIGAIPPGQGVVVGNTIPYRPEALEQKQGNFENRFTDDPEIKCFMPGVPRATYLPYPFRIIQGDKKIMFIYGFSDANRTVHMDKENPEPAPIDSYMGRSHGSWDGESLVVDVAGFNGESWFDRAGNFASNTLHVVERYTPINANALMYEATIEDPAVFTEPWTIRMPLYRRLEANAQVLEFKCVEYSEDLLYGHLRREPTRPAPEDR
tara:strand:+ start:102 stop:923 length:822 start_codon:yes stop_codon:yes gene_type:complete